MRTAVKQSVAWVPGNSGVAKSSVGGMAQRSISSMRMRKIQVQLKSRHSNGGPDSARFV